MAIYAIQSLLEVLLHSNLLHPERKRLSVYVGVIILSDMQPHQSPERACM